MSKHWPGLLLLAVWIGGAGVARAGLTAPASLDIGDVVVGQSNTADATLTSDVTSANVSVTLAMGGDCGLFSITAPATFPITVGPGVANDQKVTFKFMPIATGDRTCVATVKIGATTGPTITVKGKGIAPQITITSPMTLELQFDHVDVGKMSTLPVTVQNNGGAPLTIASASFTAGVDDYLMAGGPTAPIAASGGQATYDITCKPSTFGSRDGTFHIVSDSLNNKMIDITLKCVGDQGALASNFATLDFGRVFRGTTATRTFTLSNPGNFLVDPVTATLPPVTSGYSIDPLMPIPGTLSPPDPKQITVKFSPQNPSHGGAATLTLNGTWGTSMTAATPVQIAITGLEASFSLPDAPATLEFGMFRFDAHQPKTFQILNDGNAALVISVPFSPDQGTADNEYQLEFVKGSSVVPTPQVPLAAGERVDVIVTPHVVNRIGSVSGALEVTSDAGGSRKVMLNGIATSAKVKIPSSLEFGVVDINGPPLMKTVTIENTGDGTLDIRSIGAISATPGGVPNPAFTIMAPSALPQLPPNGKLDIPVIYRPTVASDADAGDAVVLTAQLEGSLSATATVMITGNAVFTEAHGGGGCSAGRGTAGGAAGGALLIGVAAAVALRRRRRLAGLAAPAAAVMIALAPAARADDIGIAVFEPTPATMTAGFALQAPDVGPSGSWVMNAVASYASHPLVLISLDSGGDHVATTTRVERSTLMQIGAAYALFDRLELGAHLPLYQQSGDTDKQDTSQSAVTGTALGNLAVHAKARLVQLGGAAGTFVAGASAAVVLPTASSGQFTGSDQPEGRALLLGSFTPSALSSRLALSINAGPVVRAKSEFANVIEGSGAAWGAGAAIRISDELWATGELFGEVTPSGLRRQGMDGAPGKFDTLVQLEWLAGLTVRPDRRFSLGLAVGRGVTDAVGTPELRGVLSLSVVPGAAAVAPVHPPEPVKIDGDADGDGIRDSVDKCPNEPEDKDMFEDDDGCPDPDNDHDGIPDALDKCPLDPEDKDGFQDDDGCPDKDNDGDGIPDTLDKCPNEPEDKDGFQDLDGCPDPDNDGDGIPDALDKCPNEPETINGFQDDDGCPDKGDSSIILSADRIETLDSVQFTGVKLARGAAPLLGQIAATLRAHAEIVRVRVTVHVQPSNDPDADQARSDKRAQAIRDWLVQWGIAATRLDARGFGGTKPLVPPDQRGAAKINDRLELIILERK